MNTKNLSLAKDSLSFLLLLSLLLLPALSFAGEWRVAPIRLDFDRTAKSGVITAINEADERLHLQIKAFEWSQDAEGKDQYAETGDIIFFPKIMTFTKKEERILRAGIKIPAANKEKTYRLFLEEIPDPKAAEGANVAVAIRFGVPIFSKPLREEQKGVIDKLEIAKGAVNITVKNPGNVHFVINAIVLKGKNRTGADIFSKDIAGWYLLSGVSRMYATSIPQEVCKDISRLDVEVQTEKFKLNGQIEIKPAMCLPQGTKEN